MAEPGAAHARNEDSAYTRPGGVNLSLVTPFEP